MRDSTSSIGHRHRRGRTNPGLPDDPTGKKGEPSTVEAEPTPVDGDSFKVRRMLHERRFALRYGAPETSDRDRVDGARIWRGDRMFKNMLEEGMLEV
jgi:hypothetical protein